MRTTIFLAVLVLTGSASADALTQQWDARTKLAAAQCAYAEAGLYDYTEMAAVLHVLVKRWVLAQGHKSISLRTMIRQYCSVHRGPVNPRRAFIRGLPWGTPVRTPAATDSVVFTLLWARLRNFVARFSTGSIPDPVPDAIHWGSPEDHYRAVQGLLGRVRLVRIGTDLENQRSVVLKNYYYVQR